MLEHHIAVRLKDCIFVWSKSSKCTSQNTVEDNPVILWIHNLWTEQWVKYVIQIRKHLYFERDCTGVLIGTDVYMMWGIVGESYNKHMLLGLNINANGSCTWGSIHTGNQTKEPSPRVHYCAWEHGAKMWVFGGYGPSPVDYLNDHGDFALCYRTCGTNNQLLSYEPSTYTWTNAQCFGDIPSPRCHASAAVLADTVWLYGGKTKNNFFNSDLYELNMLSFAWTKIETTMPRPNGRRQASFIPISSSQLVLYGGNGYQDEHDQNLTVPWIFNVQLHTWKQHPMAECYLRKDHTCITGLNSSAIILGGKTSRGSQHQRKSTIFYVRLEPKCLQQLAIQMIYKHKSELPWKSLPKNLTCKIMAGYDLHAYLITRSK